MEHDKHIAGFLQDESGAAVVDWAIITVAVIVVGNYLFEDVAGATRDIAQGINDSLMAIEIPKSFRDYADYR